jgi:hypothetical protein
MNGYRPARHPRCNVALDTFPSRTIISSISRSRSPAAICFAAFSVFQDGQPLRVSRSGNHRQGTHDAPDFGLTQRREDFGVFDRFCCQTID